MSEHFRDVPLTWNGKTYTVRANQMLGLIARIEDVVTMQELQQFAMRKATPLGKMAQAYGAALRYAGANVSDDDVYVGMFGEGSGQIAEAVALLLALMMPPASMLTKAAATNPMGGGSPGPLAGKRLSKKVTKAPSLKRAG